jgi:hypothetical protein
MTRREITIVVDGFNDFRVHCDGLIADRLVWGEMIECLADLTHPSIDKSHGSARYMRSPADIYWQAERYALRDQLRAQGRIE